MLDPRRLSPPPTPRDSSSGQALTGGAEVRISTAARRYGFAVGVVIVAFLLRLMLYGELDNRLPFAFFLPAAMIAAWYGGFGPGMLAAVAGLLLGDYFFLPAHHAYLPLGQAERTAIAVYSVTSTLAVILMENLHGKIRNLECELKKRGTDPE